MTDGKSTYENIPIPDQLPEVLEQALRRGRKTIMKRRFIKGAAAMAACFCLVLLGGSQEVYATISGIPVIGKLVQIFYTGQGGEITDGAAVYLNAEKESLDIRFETAGTTSLPHYDVQYKQMPERLVVTLSGVRKFDRENMQDAAQKLSGVRDIYFVTILDDSAVRFAIELQPGTGYTIKEFNEPGYLQVEFSPKEQTPGNDAFVLRSPSTQMGESLAALQEQLMEYGADIVKTQAEMYTVTVGSFHSQADAKKAMDEITVLLGADHGFLIEQLSPDQSPQ